jgi:hypothetical protein
VGKWELIIALAIFAVNGILGYLAKREKDKARRNAELEGLEVPDATSARPEVRVDPSPSAPAPPRTVPVELPSSGPRRPARGKGSSRPPAPPRTPAGSLGKAKGPPKGPSKFQQKLPPAKKPKVSPKAPARVAPVAEAPPRPEKVAPPSVATAKSPAPTSSVPSPAERIRGRLNDPAALQSVLIWTEVLGRPRGLHPFEPAGRD